MPMIRITDPALHRQVKLAAITAGTTVAAWTADALRAKLVRTASPSVSRTGGMTQGPDPAPAPQPKYRTLADLPPLRYLSKADSCK